MSSHKASSTSPRVPTKAQQRAAKTLRDLGATVTFSPAPGVPHPHDEFTPGCFRCAMVETIALVSTKAKAPRQTEPSATGDRLNPDCRSGKCAACSGTAWDDDADSLTACSCVCHGGVTS